MSSLLFITHFPPWADTSGLPNHVQQYLRDTEVSKYFICERFRHSKVHQRLGGTFVGTGAFCLLAVRSKMVKDEEDTFAHESSASFLRAAGVGILWIPLGRHVQFDFLTNTSWDVVSPRLGLRILQRVHELYRVHERACGGRKHADGCTQQVLTSLKKRLFYFPWEQMAAAGEPTYTFRSCSQYLRHSGSQ